jgi:adenylate cyclase
MTACGTCNVELRPAAKFCDECGAPVSSVARSAEYKQVTVLFADVVHSMNIATAVGPERLREIMTELVERATDVVTRYGGTVNQFTGDGLMAVFGAPLALEDHAFRACLAALGIHDEVKLLASDIRRRDAVDLHLRIGLNSGAVIAGEIGTGALGYTAIGDQVGMAQRMESVAPPGGVMLSDSTARLVENTVDLGERELVHIKGADAPVAARRLLAIVGHQPSARTESKLVGRTWELNTVTAILEETTRGLGGVVNIVGPAGIGKSRLVREVTAIASARNVPVFATYCESHTSDIPFHVIARLIRATSGIEGLDRETARAHLRNQTPHIDSDDVRILEDLLGVRDPAEALPAIAPDARRRRLTALINAGSMARTEPAVFVIEDAHWVDEASESLLTEFMAVIPQTPSLMLITYRPEYVGALTRVPGTQTIALRPLTDEQLSVLSTELLGADPSLRELTALVAERAAGNPFFAEETVRDLAERGVLTGRPGAYELHGNVTNIEVPATLQATIGARIDRLDPAAKKTLNAAAVVGMRFDADLLTALVVDADVTPLIDAQLVDQVRFAPRVECSFRHPLIRAVAYESQLKVDRAQLHQRLAATIESRASPDENAALIAEHMEAAGDLHAAFDWHMRAATWSTWRNIAAARSSWNRAQQVADRLPDDEPDRMVKRIAPRTLLCANAYRFGGEGSVTDFDELRALCAAAGDDRSLAIAMCGSLLARHVQGKLGRDREMSGLATELNQLLDSVGDPTLTVALCVPLITAKLEVGEMTTVLKMAQQVIDFADGDHLKGKILTVSPLTSAIALRGLSRALMGLPGWRDDFDRAIAAADAIEPAVRSGVIWYVYVYAIPNGVLLLDATALRETAEILAAAEQSGDNLVLDMARAARAITVVHHEGSEREASSKLLAELYEAGVQGKYSSSNNMPVIQIHHANEKARLGDFDGAIELVRPVLDELFATEEALWTPRGAAVLVESLLRRGSDGDFREAQAAIERLAAFPTEPGLVLHDIWLLRLRTLMAQAQGDEAIYRDLRDNYRKMAADLGFEGHMAWAAAMP